ncbi:hypothetical protein J1N35_023759 [Gossypium stocksii]|uniref:Piwi domain-containing protein n=1 Tax=Gossypium stocksii TaxID=47602 RepID=A0A9D3VJ43_9ROSI|nr:hypothetical protein J1N35_023759 [Gossypium stocksii]
MLEQTPSILVVSKVPTIIIGIDVALLSSLFLTKWISRSSEKRKPNQIIIFRDGVSESQFNQVLNKELDQVIKACKFLDEDWNPKFAQKNHHTKFFQQGSSDDVLPGTVIDNKVCNLKNNDFYLCVHAGPQGRPTIMFS